MAQVLGDNTTSNSRYFQRGIFVDKAKILSVENLSNNPVTPGAEIHTDSNDKPREIALRLKIDVGFEMDMWVFGKYNFKTDTISGKRTGYLGWKPKHNATQNLLAKLLGSNAVINDDGTIPDSTLNRLIGQEFYRLRYCQPRAKMYQGKPSFQTFDIFAKAIEGNDDILYKEFLKSNVKADYYDPLLFDEYTAEQRANSESFDTQAMDSPAKEDII